MRDEFAARLNDGGAENGAERIAHYFSAKTFTRFERDPKGRGLHSSTRRLNLNRFCH